MTAIELRGRVVIDDTTEVSRVWVVDGRLTFERPPVIAEVIAGCVLPGLVDVHCHVGLGPGGAVDEPTTRAQALTNRDSGVLLIRDAGSPGDTRWVDDAPELPRLIRAGRHIARPMRYLRHYARELDDVTQLPDVVAEEASRGDGWVKLVGDWIDRSKGADADLEPLWPGDVLATAVVRASAVGARVTVHSFATETIDDLLDAGVPCIEHATGASASQIDRMAAAGVAVTPTLLQVENFAAIAAQGLPRYPRFAARMSAMHARREAQVMDLYDAGVRLLVGTDAGGTIGHGRIADEAAAMVAAGIPAADVVAAASWRTRAWLGSDGITEGASADVVIYEDDPRQDIRALHSPHAVLLRGERVR